MTKRAHTIDQIIVCRELGVAEQTYYRWRRRYGSLSVAQARRLTLLEKENARLRQVVADLALDRLVFRGGAGDS